MATTVEQLVAEANAEQVDAVEFELDGCTWNDKFAEMCEHFADRSRLLVKRVPLLVERRRSRSRAR